MTPPKNVEQMVTEIIALDPKSSSFVSSYFSSVIIDGQVIPLVTVDSKYGVGYVRVSTAMQNDDGWSVEDQARRIVAHFVNRREAFRVFSDASLSGKLPNNDPGLIAKMLNASAKRYESAYRAVFRQSDYPDEWTQMEANLVKILAKIKTGGAAEIAAIDLETAPSGSKRKMLYRPALTEMMLAVQRGFVHTVAFTDVTRLSRSNSLSGSLMDDLKDHNVKVIGLIETLDWMTDELGGAITSAVLSLIAEYKLREVCLGSIRGLATMLGQGKPHGRLPYYLRRDDDKNAHIVPDRVDTVKRIIAYWLDNPSMGVDSVCRYLNENLDEYPAPVLEGEKLSRMAKGRWHRDTLYPMLRNEMLLGCQEFFGRRWKTVPHIIDQRTFDRLQIIMDPKQINKAAHLAINGNSHTAPNHLLTGLLECQCGHKMVFYPMSKQFSYYRCTEIRNRQKTDKHCTIRASTVEDFFDSLIRIYGNTLVSALADNEDTQLLREQIGEYQEEKKRLEHDLIDAILVAREKAVERFTEDDNEITPENIENWVNSHRPVRALRSQIADVDEQIRQREIVLSQIVPEGAVATTQENIAKWQTLDVKTKNVTLKTIIKRAVFRLIEEGGMEVEITPTGVKAKPLPTITLSTNLYQNNIKLRRFPSVSEWIAGW